MRQVALVLTAFLCVPPALADFDAAFYTRISLSVVKIRAYTDQGKMYMGSGVVVAPDEVLTNCHVTRRAAGVNVVKSALEFPVLSQRVDIERDLCLLKTDAMPLPAVEVRGTAGLGPGEPTFYYGFTGGNEGFFAQGKVTALHPLDGTQVIETTSGFGLGASGGGLFDKSGKLLGITTFLAAGHHGAYYAMPAELLVRLRQHQSQPVGPVEGTAIWEKPESEQPYFLRIARLSGLNQLDEAVRVATLWTHSESSNPDSWLSLGQALNQQGRYADSVVPLRRAIELAPKDGRAFYQLGYALSRSGKTKQAEDVRTTLTSLDPDLAKDLGKALDLCSATC